MSATRNRIFILALLTFIFPLFASNFLMVPSTPPITSAIPPVPTLTPRILYYTEFADNTPIGEAANVWAAINATHGTNYMRTNLTSYLDLATELPNHDIFLIIEQELIYSENVTDVAAAWQTPLNTFLADGGIILTMTFYSLAQGDYGLTARILNETGLLTFSALTDRRGDSIVIDEPTNPLVDGVVPFIGPDGTVGFDTSETTSIASVDIIGQPILIHKPIGVGHLVLMGFDCYDRHSETDKILGNAIRLYQPPSAPTLNDPGTTIQSFIVPLSWSAATDTDGIIDHYEYQASTDAGFSIIGQTDTTTTTNGSFVFLVNGTYYFRVRAIDNNSLAGPWSNVEDVVVAIPPITWPNIPGFPIEAIALGLLLSLGAIFVVRRRKQQKVSP
ncbi:MAG: Loki-CTERM sorting domain-containing protein [Candidatus Hodarchaeota archaeon]